MITKIFKKCIIIFSKQKKSYQEIILVFTFWFLPKGKNLFFFRQLKKDQQKTSHSQKEIYNIAKKKIK